jgi:2-oxoglutarate ferredoxin oxidoreductase subunit alpha
MQKKLLWKIGGEAGFGIMTTGLLLAKNATRRGYHIYEYAEYPSLIRGGHNTEDVVISDEPVYSTKEKIDILFCLNKETFAIHKKRLHKDSVVVYEKDQFTLEGEYRFIDLPFRKIIKEELATVIMINNIALGASLALMGWDLQILDEIIEESFEKKGPEVISENKRVAKRGFDHIHTDYNNFINREFPKKEGTAKAVMTGNDAFSYGAVVADCGLYCAYPMTPSSTVLTTLAEIQQKVGMVVRHAEDEISVINTALGGSYAGARTSVGTSGGGFALMAESISLAGVTELPVVIYLAQRPGPATGLPTWTEQGDLLFAVHAGHGEFPKIVLAPGDVEEIYTLTAKAFDLADVYQTPVIVLTDKLIGEGHQSTDYNNLISFSQNYKPNRGKLITEATQPYFRYMPEADGISPRLIPGQKGIYYQANSYEHSRNGHTTEDAYERIEQVDKRNKKQQTFLQNDFQMPTIIGDFDTAEIIIVSWGGNKGAIVEAMKELTEQNIHVAYIHFTYVYPLDAKKLMPLFLHDKTYVLIENNSDAQFGKLLRQEVGIEIKDHLLKYDGRPIFYEEIIEYIKKI